MLNNISVGELLLQDLHKSTLLVRKDTTVEAAFELYRSVLNRSSSSISLLHVIQASD
jgi:hypothetical protein